MIELLLSGIFILLFFIASSLGRIVDAVEKKG